MKLEFKFNDIFDFYTESDIVAPWGRSEAHARHCKEEEKEFRGLSLVDIEKSKYSYKEGLDKLKELDLEMNQGSNGKKYKWSEDDGDDMSTERLNEQLPFLYKRINTLGDKNGKFITLHVSICENAFISYNQLLCRAYTTIQIADYLENNGFKVQIISHCPTRGCGTYQDKDVDYADIMITLKKPEEPLNKSLLLTTISPWFFRYHMFKFLYAKLNSKWGNSLGSAWDQDNKDSKTDIYLHSGSCLDKKSAERRINSIKKLFNTSEDNE